jgi:hypothetical protein
MTGAVFPSLMDIGARDPATHVVFSRGESIGLAFDTLAGLVSALAAACVLMLIFVSLDQILENRRSDFALSTVYISQAGNWNPSIAQ